MTEALKGVVIDGVDGAFRGTLARDGEVVLVPGAAPGDEVDVLVTARSRRKPEAYGMVKAVKTRGDGYRTPPCEHAAPVRGACGGCPGMHLQAALRRETLQRETTQALGDLLGGGLKFVWHDAPEELGYRNRSNFVVGRRGGEDDEEPQAFLGSFAPGSNELARMEGCLVVTPGIASVHARLEEILNNRRWNIPLGLEEQGLRWVCLREAGGEVVVELVVADETAKYVVDFVDAVSRFEGVRGVAVSRNDEDTNAIRRGEANALAGDVVLWERYGRVKLGIPPDAFAQLNVAVASEIYEAAATFVEGAGVIWDFYSGIGALGLNAAVGTGAKLVGLESVAEAVSRAALNAEAAGVEALFGTCDLTDADALEAASAELAREVGAPEAILVNPPRKGVSPALLQALTSRWTDAGRLVYMSCDATTFARDARTLATAGWKLVAVDGYEMLPQTRHVELLGCFTR